MSESKKPSEKEKTNDRKLEVHKEVVRNLTNKPSTARPAVIRNSRLFRMETE